jgi:hypothetical protein
MGYRLELNGVRCQGERLHTVICLSKIVHKILHCGVRIGQGWWDGHVRW